MVDLRMQLQSYVESTIERVDVDDVIARVADVRSLDEARRRRRPMVVAAAAAVATLVLVGGAIVLALWLTRGDAPVVTTVPAPSTTVTVPPTTTTAPTTTTTAATTTTITTTTTVDALDPADAAAWANASLILLEEEIPPFLGEGHIINGLAANGSVVVAVGDAMGEEENGMRDGLIWISEDGRTWERVSDPEDLEFGGKGLYAVVAGGPGFVAAGVSCDTEERCTAGWRAAIWTSVDGLEWDRVPYDSAVFGERSGIFRLAATDGRVWALGMACDETVCEREVWSSPDGLTWDRREDGSSFTPEQIAEGGGGLVAVGTVPTETGAHARVWTSDDGIDWQQVPEDPAVFGDGDGSEISMNGVAGGPQGFAAIGKDGSDAVIWFSPDGSTWERIPDTAGIFTEASIYDVFSWDGGFLAVGPDWAVTEDMGGPAPGRPFVPSRPTVWVSPDGRTWQPVGVGEEEAVGAVRALTRFESMLIVGGQSGVFLEGQDAVWVNEQPPGLGG